FRLTPDQARDVQLFQTRKTAFLELQKAFQDGNLRRIAASYTPLLDDYTKITPGERAFLQLASLFALAYTECDDDKIVAAFEAVQQSPFRKTIIFSIEEQVQIREAQNRKSALLRFRDALKSGRPQQIIAVYNAQLIGARLADEERAQYRLA